MTTTTVNTTPLREDELAAALERRERENTILHRELRAKDREIRDLRRIVLTGRAA